MIPGIAVSQADGGNARRSHRSDSPIRLASLIAFTALLALVASACAAKPPIVIGLGGSMSGSDAALGVSGRNAAQLFVRRANEAGGLKGRRLELAIGDFKSDPSLIVPTDRSLLRRGAVVIVGHFTSAQAIAAVDFANAARIVLVSPSATTESLGGKDDFFFRTGMSSRHDAEAIAANMAERGLRRLLVIETTKNKAYADTYTKPLAEAGLIALDLPFSDPKAVDFERAAAARADSILIIAVAVDAGFIAQGLRIRGLRQPLYLCGWAATAGDDIVKNGGSAVEGAWFAHQTDETEPALAPIKADYKAVYGTDADFEVLQTWDTMCLVRAAIEAGGTDREAFYRAIRDIRSFRGGADIIQLDEHGDATRSLFIRTIRDGAIEIVGRYK
jgi:branched-chain amino acid transport system substrate-binding protein